MSQSPDGDATRAATADLVRYRNAWTALNQLIGQGDSFSGHERNCVYLNTGIDFLPDGAGGAGKTTDTRRFADVSAATGLDRPDDGRAVALTDWDFDGDLDLWVANRTAPRVRLLRNDTESGHHWLAIRLQGVTSNRDAIGARVEVVRGKRGGEARRPRYIKTLHAGDGYLSQSSKWIHFGLGTSAEIDRVVVSWPGGDREEFTGLSADTRYRLVQGSGRAEVWTPPGQSKRLNASPVELPPPESSIRTVIVGRVPLPEARYRSWDGKEVSLDAHRGKALLVNLFSRTCAPCLQELAEWTKREDALRSAGLDILALCVDGMVDAAATGGTERETTGRELLTRLGFPFASGSAQPELVDLLEIVNRVYLELQKPLPVPSSFLLDSSGRLGVIYKGRIRADRLLADVELLAASPEARRESAVPFRGRWASRTFPPSAEPIGRALDVAGRTDAAVAYLRRFIALAADGEAASRPGPQPETLVAAIRRLGELEIERGRLDEAAATYSRLLTAAPADTALHRDVARELLTKGRLEEACRHFEIALRGEPDDPQLLYNFGLAELGLRRPRRAAELFRHALEARPDDVTTHFHLANSLLALGDASAAVAHFRRALELRPGWPYAANNLAWVLATHPDAGIRDGAEAVRIAERLCRATNYSDHATLATLAAAYAEAGRFADAVRTNQRALDIAREKAQETTVRQLLERQESYVSGQPFRDTGK